MHERDVFLNLLRLVPVHQLGNKKMVQDTHYNSGDYTIDESGLSAAFLHLEVFFLCPGLDYIHSPFPFVPSVDSYNG